MTTQNQQLSDALAANYLLADLQIRSWSGKKTDKEATGEFLDAKSATRDGGAFVKNLLASANDELKKVQQEGAALRSYVYSHTLPWSSASTGAKRGDRILATSAAMKFLTDLKPLKQDYDRAVNELKNVWDHRVSQAMSNLGALADATDYPTATDLPDLFSVAIDLKPIPAVSDYSRLNVPAELAQNLGARHEQLAQVQYRNAMSDLKDRLLEGLERMHVQLGKQHQGEKTRLHESLLTNLQGLVSLAQHMDMGTNPRFTEVVARIEQQLLQTPVAVYKVNPRHAGVVASAAQQLATEVAMEEVWS